MKGGGGWYVSLEFMVIQILILSLAILKGIRFLSVLLLFIDFHVRVALLLHKPKLVHK